MSGETDLDVLLGSMSAGLADEVFVFVTVENTQSRETLAPVMTFEEAEGTTLILRKSEAEAHGLPFEFPCRMITLEVHSSLEAVGFLARITTALARHGMGVNPVSGYYHDHLFVPDGREAEALAVLDGLARGIE